MKISKILCSLAIATVTISQLPISAYAKSVVHRDVILEEESEMSFSDVSPNHWAYRAIKKLVEEYGVIGGFPDGTFRGNRNLTRYEAAAMIAKVMEKVEDLAAKGGKPSVGRADVDRLKKEFMTELEDLQSEVKRLSKDQQDLQKDLDETKDDLDLVKDMMPKVKLMGDAAARYELKTFEFSADKFLVNAPELRLRLGAYGESANGFTFGTRISTSIASDITNQYVSMGNMASKIGINLDQLYIAARPWDGALDLTVGKHEVPFMKTTELLWDNDVNLDGAYLKFKFGDKMNHLTVLGDYTLFGLPKLDPAKPASGVHRLTVEGPDGTAGMWSAGVSGGFGSEESVSFMLGANYHQFTNVNNLIGKTLSLNPRTNYLTADGKSYVSNFQLLTGSLGVSIFPGAYLPVNLHADLSYNLGAGKNSGAQDATNSSLRNSAGAEAFGLIAGVSLGKMEESGNVMLGYNYKMVGTDSVFSAFNEDQLGGTNVSAHEFKVGFQMAQMTALMATMQLSNRLVNTSNVANPSLYTIRATVMQKF